MNQNFKSAMLAAAELTAAGNLNAATALIQRALAGDDQPPAAASAGTASTAGADGPHAGPGFQSAPRTTGKAAAEVIDVDARWVADGEQSPGKASPIFEAGSPFGTVPPFGNAASFGNASSFGAGSLFGAVPPFGGTSSSGTASGAGESKRPFQSVDWQALAAGLASKAAAFQQADAGRPAGPGTAVDHGGKGSMVPGAFTAPAGTRDYLLYLPPGEAGPKGRSLVVMLHGCTQNPSDFAAGTAMNAIADREGFAVLYPAQTKAANQSGCWNWFNPRDQRAGGGEPSILAGMVRDVIAKHGIDPARVNVAGLSAGGAMAAILADAYPDLFAAVAVHSGLPTGAAHDLPSALAAMKRGSPGQAADAGATAGTAAARPAARPVRTIVFHGRQDRTVHPSNGRQIAGAALSTWPTGALVVKREDGRSSGGRSFTRTIHADAAGKPMVEQWEIQGAGHAWSGGSASGSYTDPQGPDASAAMVEFFKAG